MKHSKSLTELPQTYPQFSKPSFVDPSPNPANSNSFFASAFYYEPTSVLDPHLSSSPAAAANNNNTAAKAAATNTADLSILPWAEGGDGGGDDHHHNLLPPSSDDWDTVSWFLSEKDDLSSFSKPQLPLPEEPNASFGDTPFELTPFDPFSKDQAPSPPPPPAAATAAPVNFDRTHLDSLVRAAQCFEANDFASAHVILSRLNQQLPSLAGTPLQRAAFLFKEAIFSLLRPSTASPEPPLSSAELVRRIAAQKAFSDLSPVPHFATFTATQTLLEAFDAVGAAGSIHLIDFEFGLGGQWSSFAQDLAARSRVARSPPPTVRITAVVVEETTETALAAENLRDFARSIGLRLTAEFVRVDGLGMFPFSGVRLGGAIEPVAVFLTPAIFRLLGASCSPETTAAVLRFVRRASPRVVVFVDTEHGASDIGQPPSLSRSVAAGVEYYAALLESLEAAAAATGAGEEVVRRVEREAIRPRVLGSAEGWAGPIGPWLQVLSGAGWAPVAFSVFAESQAQWLVRRAPVGGYHVARRDGALVLSWKGKELAATSAWRC